MATDGECEGNGVHRMSERYKACGALKRLLFNIGLGRSAKKCLYEGEIALMHNVNKIRIIWKHFTGNRKSTCNSINKKQNYLNNPSQKIISLARALAYFPRVRSARHKKNNKRRNC